MFFVFVDFIRKFPLYLKTITVHPWKFLYQKRNLRNLALLHFCENAFSFLFRLSSLIPTILSRISSLTLIYTRCLHTKHFVPGLISLHDVYTLLCITLRFTSWSSLIHFKAVKRSFLPLSIFFPSKRRKSSDIAGILIYDPSGWMRNSQLKLTQLLMFPLWSGPRYVFLEEKMRKA